MTLREVVEMYREEDAEPLEASFIIACVLRTTVQGEVSTFEGDASTIMLAMDHYDVRTWDGVDAWLDDLEPVSSHEYPRQFWLKISETRRAETVSSN